MRTYLRISLKTDILKTNKKNIKKADENILCMYIIMVSFFVLFVFVCLFQCRLSKNLFSQTSQKVNYVFSSRSKN